tara:strand:+ start:369 stop:557 length:189 start_codon:yes stop_codon:yes gene_type:complete
MLGIAILFFVVFGIYGIVRILKELNKPKEKQDKSLFWFYHMCIGAMFGVIFIAAILGDKGLL